MIYKSPERIEILGSIQAQPLPIGEIDFQCEAPFSICGILSFKFGPFAPCVGKGVFILHNKLVFRDGLPSEHPPTFPRHIFDFQHLRLIGLEPLQYYVFDGCQSESK